MSIESLIKSEKTHLTECLPDDYLDEAVNSMVTANRNAMAVIDDSNHLRGILTDHDVIRAVNACNKKASNVDKEFVSSWMTSQVITCDIDTTLTMALSLMGKHRIRHLMAVKDNRPVAVVSIRDILSKMHEDDLLEINVLRDMARVSRVNTAG